MGPRRSSLGKRWFLLVSASQIGWILIKIDDFYEKNDVKSYTHLRVGIRAPYNLTEDLRLA